MLRAAYIFARTQYRRLYLLRKLISYNFKSDADLVATFRRAGHLFDHEIVNESTYRKYNHLKRILKRRGIPFDDSMKWTDEQFAEKEAFRKYPKVKSGVVYEDFYKLAKLRQTVRHFSGKKVPIEAVKKALAAGVEAPCSCNRQSWTFRIVTGVQDKKVLSWVNGAPYIVHAPVAVIQMATMDNYRIQEGKGTPYLDAGTAAQTILLAATTQGLASCFVNMGHVMGRKKRKLYSYFKIGKTKVVPNLLLFGYPEKKIIKPRRNNVDKYIMQ